MNHLLSLLSPYTLPEFGNPFSRGPRSSAAGGRTRQRTRLFMKRLEPRSLRTRLHLEPLEVRTVPTAVAVPSGVVSWWTANNTPADVYGLNNATLYGVTYATGEVGKAFSFDGIDDWAALGDPSSLAFTASFTIEGWINVNGLPTNYNFGSIMFRGDDRPGLDPYQLVILPNGDLQFQITGAPGTPTGGTASLEAPIPTGQFVHVAATLDDGAGAMTLYENGAVVAQTTTTVRPFGALDPTQQPGVGIGNSNALSNYNIPFNGLIDELSVYNRALTAGEVLGIYKAGSSGKVISPIAVNFPSVVNGSGGATTPITFTITRTGSLSGSLTVNWTTADDTATAGTNYVAASGTVTFADGQATQTVQVTTLNDTTPEPNVNFKLIATPAGGTSIMGLATILTDNTTISVSNDTATEGDTAIRSLGAFIPAGLGGLTDAYAIIYGPDGNVYVSTLNGSAVYRYDAAGTPLPASGQSGAVFVSPGSGGLSTGRDIAFGPDGYLYVVSEATNAILRYDPTTGAPAGTMVASGSGGLEAPRGLLFRGGYVYVTSVGATGTGPGASSVLRFDAVTGLAAGVSGVAGDAVFIPGSSGGLTNPSRIIFGSDGNAYVASMASSSNAVLRYDGTTGAFINAFVPSGSGGLDGPAGMLFRPDGYLYVVGWRSNSVLRYQAFNGAFAGTVVPPGSGGVSSPIDLLFDGSGNILVTSRYTDQVLRYGAASRFAFTVSLGWASVGTTTVNYATADGTALAGTDYLAVSGTLTFPPGLTSQTIVVQTLDDGHADPTKAFTINLSNPTGGVITNGQGIGTILNGHATKFFVVDADTDGTYRYNALGQALGNSTLGSGNTAPRGVASNAAGTTIWVVDANNNVYVYNPSGALLGSWAAGGLPISPEVTGIATDGSDIWIVANRLAKVYKYTGAASLLSGAQRADESFRLDNADTDPQDIVTDGTYFWVVDGSALQVFKYTLTGSLLGSWTIDPANTDPAGIAIEPNNVSDIWIVDRGTLQVYQYTAAAGRTSGSQNASAIFGLAPGDTDPQGIADPPAQPSGDSSAVASIPLLASRDVVFALLARGSLSRRTQVSVDLMADAALPPDRNCPILVAGGAWVPAGASDEQKLRDNLAPLSLGNRGAFRSERSALGLLDRSSLDEENQASAVDLIV